MIVEHALARLQTAYRDRLALLRRARAEGRCVIGHVGPTVPAELITACGALPLRIAPVDGEAAAADAWIEPFADRDARLIFAGFVAGHYDALDLLVIPRSSETWHKLYLALREARRTGLKPTGPDLWLHDVLHTQRESSRRYGLARQRELLAQVAHRSGRSADADALGAAVAQGNAIRRQLQQVQAWRQQGRLDGRTAQQVLGSTRFMAPDDAERDLDDFLYAAPLMQPLGPRLFVHGVPLDHDALHALVDACGGCIVQDDDEWGSRAGTPLVDEQADPFEAVFDHYWRDVPCLRIHPPPPGAPAFIAAARAGAIDGVIFNLPRPDDLHGWRFPADREAADAIGLPWLLVRDDARDAAAFAGLRAALAGFIDRLRRG